MSLIPRIHPPHPREPVDKCSSPSSSAIIMIFVISRGIIKLCYAKINVVSYLLVKASTGHYFFAETVVSTSLPHSPLGHPLTVMAALRLSTCVDLDTTVAWSRAAPGAASKNLLTPVVQTLDSAFHRINHYSVDKY